MPANDQKLRGQSDQRADARTLSSPKAAAS